MDNEQAFSTVEHAIEYLESRVPSARGSTCNLNMSIRGCGRYTHVSGTNGGTMPCGANLTQFGVTAPYYCAKCEPFILRQN